MATDINEVEIARYPMQCNRCGKTEQVRVFAKMIYDPLLQDRNELLTRRVAPAQWTWELANGHPLWVCPDCRRTAGR